MIDIAFSQHYRTLILKYGLVFGGLSQQLEDARKVRGPVWISAEAGEWEQVVGDLSFSINRGNLSTPHTLTFAYSLPPLTPQGSIFFFQLGDSGFTIATPL